MKAGYLLHEEYWAECLECYEKFHGISIGHAREKVVRHIELVHELKTRSTGI